MSSNHPDRSPGSPFRVAFSEVLGDLGKAGYPAQSTDDNIECLTELCECLGTHFGQACACGLAQQIGRSAFTHLVRSANGLEDLMEQSFRLLPEKMRLTRGLGHLEKLVEELFGIPVEMIDGSDTISLETSDYLGEHQLIPHMETGFIQEFILWVGGGKPHPVSIHTGKPGWSILIGKQPFDL
jgi:hypothetical protein